MSKETDILEGMHYDILLKWIEGGKIDTLPEGMSDYMKHLTAVIGFHNQLLNKSQITKRLRATFGLSYHIAKNRYMDAINFFYLDEEITHESYMKMYVDKLDKATDLILQTARGPEDIKVAITGIEKAVAIREKIKPKEKVSDKLFERFNKIYTLKPEDLGMESANRNELAKMIDKMRLEETEKLRINQEAGIAKKTENIIFDYYEPKTED